VIRGGDAGGNGEDIGSDLAIDAAGDVWVSGYSSNGRPYGQDFALWRFDAQGRIADGFPVVRDGAAGGRQDDAGSAIAISPDGSVWVAGYSMSARSRVGDTDFVLWRFLPR